MLYSARLTSLFLFTSRSRCTACPLWSGRSRIWLGYHKGEFLLRLLDINTPCGPLCLSRPHHCSPGLPQWVSLRCGTDRSWAGNIFPIPQKSSCSASGQTQDLTALLILFSKETSHIQSCCMCLFSLSHKFLILWPISTKAD